jgi:hypothetical protein
MGCTGSPNAAAHDVVLESWLRVQEAVCEGQRHFQVLWLPSNASWLDRIE